MAPSSIRVPPNAEMPGRHPGAPLPGAELPSHYVRCFACGVDEDHGLRMRFTAGEGLIVIATVAVTERHQGAPGLAHGGLVASALDETMAMLGHLTCTSLVTARLVTDFRRPVPVGATLHISARLDGRLRRQSYLSAVARLGDADGQVAARARAVFVEVELGHFVTHARPEDIQRVAADPSQVDLRGHQAIL